MNRIEYLEKLQSRMHNGLIKVITGIRRCGKSYLLFTLFRNYLLESGVPENRIISLALDDKMFTNLRNPLLLDEYIRQRITDNTNQFYLLIDEIQYCVKIKLDNMNERMVVPEDRDSLYISFYEVLNGIQRLGNVDIYVTGSNSKMLSDDIRTEFRGRGDEIRIHPFSFAEYHACLGGDKYDEWEDYMLYGGMPLAVLDSNEQSRRAYLINLFEEVYIKDIIEHNDIKDQYLLESLLDTLSSSIGSLTNPTKLANTINSTMSLKTSSNTIDLYTKYFAQSFLFNKAKRYDVKGKKYFDTPYKLYSEDVGLRNARLNWRQQERSHLMENILFNELIRRDYTVDIGVVTIETRQDGKRELRQHEIDFIINKGFNKIYIQSSFAMDTLEKQNQELLPFMYCRDFFRKVVITGGNEKLWADEQGILHIGIIPFLLDKKILE
ncbi:MAG: ATP-binding protein [Lentisphaeria bacterium]|nr:ATP-binding protein [Lentisphaeria bacterium]